MRDFGRLLSGNHTVQATYSSPHSRGLFLESPETFRAHFGWHNSLCIFKTKASRGTKLCSYFYFYSLYNIWEDQLYRISRPEFDEWLFGPENLSGLSRNRPQVIHTVHNSIKIIISIPQNRKRCDGPTHNGQGSQHFLFSVCLLLFKFKRLIRDASEIFL